MKFNKSHYLLFLSLTLCLASTLWAQSQVKVFPKVKSQIALPISIPVSEVSSLINKSIQGLIYQDDSYTDHDNDQFKVKVWKDGVIELTALKDNRFLISVPLKIWAEQGYGGFGQYVYQDTNFGVVMKFITSVEMKNDWTLNTQTKAYGFDWTVKPVLDYGKIKIPISSLIEKTLNEQQGEFTTIIDQQIKESFDLKPYLLLIWNQFAEPIKVSEDYNTWLKLTPREVYMSPLKIYSDYIQASIGLELYSETFVGRIPTASPMVNRFPNYILKTDIPNEFNLKTTAHVTFDDATELARKQFVGQEFALTGEKSKVRVTDMKMFTDRQLVVLEIHTEGAIKGISTIKGVPYYDKTKQRIALTDVKFSLKTKNILKKALALVFEKKIKRMITEEYGVPMGDIIQESKKSLLENFNKEYYPGIYLNGRVVALEPTEIMLFDRYMTIVIDTHAKLQLKVEGLNLN